jgi:SAM-dependent methyltransferase
VLDIACGSGIISRTVAPLVGPSGQVVGLDASPAMLSVARQAAAADGLDIEWQVGSAQELPFPDRSFDLVLCQHGLQFFPDRFAALTEMHRVLVPGGKVVIVTWRGLDQHPLFAAFARAVRRHVNATAIETPFSLGDPLQLATLLQEADFGGVAVEPVAFEADYARPERFVALQVAAAEAAIPALQGLSSTERDSLIAAIGADLAIPVANAMTGDRLRVPMQAIVARGTRVV